MQQLPRNGVFKTMENSAKIVVSDINKLKETFDIIYLDSQFRDKLNGTVLCVLLYVMPITEEKLSIVASGSRVRTPVAPASKELIVKEEKKLDPGIETENLPGNEPPF